MKTVIIILLGISALLFVFSSDTINESLTNPLESDTYFDMDQMGIKDVKDVTPLVVQALEICKREGFRGIRFPKGTYHFYPTFAPDFYAAITNNDNGLKRTPFPLFDFDNFHIDGGASEFIFHGKLLPFIIERSSNITVSDLSIDWEVPFFVQGTVIDSNEKAQTFDLEMETPYKVEDNHLYLTIEKEDSPFNEKFGDRFSKQLKYDQMVGQNIIWDRATKAPLYNHIKYSGFGSSTFFEAAEIKEGIVQLNSEYQLLPPVGSVFVSKGEYLFNRQVPAFRVFKSKALLFQNINVHHAGAMGLIAERSMDITLDSFNVVLRAGTNRVVTTTADATHFCNCKGKITIKNCTFENMLDDATNIHGTYARVKKILTENQIAYETYHPHQMDYLFGEAGDSIRIVDQKTLMPKSEILVIQKIKRINERLSIMTLNQSVKGLIAENDGIENISWYASALIENNTIRNNRARGLLISTTRKVEVRNNYISSQMAGMLMTGDLNLWNESGPCDSLIIENNRFVNNLHGGYKQAVIMIGPEQDLSDYREDSYYSRDVIIRNNTIEAFDASILRAKSVDGLIFEGNEVIQTAAYQPLFPNEPNLNIDNCKGVRIENNTFQLLSGSLVELSTMIKPQSIIPQIKPNDL